MFFAESTALTKDFNSNLYTQYHCLPRTRNVNIEDSDCHSIILKIKLELLSILVHHDIGKKQTNKSPHLP